MKIKKIIAGICAAAISVSALAATVGAGTDSKSVTISSITANMSLNVNSNQVIGMAYLGANPLDYDILEARVTINFDTKNNTDGYTITEHAGGKWVTGGCGCNGFPQIDFSITSANSSNDFRINGKNYYGYTLSATA